MDTTTSVSSARDSAQRITSELAQVIVGQDEIVKRLVASLFSNGHCLLIGVPGLAKTLLVQSIAEVLGISFKRIQFTPDLMPSDIIGSEVIHEGAGRLEFQYRPGPVFTNLLLADEINRTPPKTQSALLEAMQERKVTVAGENRVLPNPFLVIATQNPIEQEGTYPLPEAQLDRFMFSLDLGYPSPEEEMEIVKRTTIGAGKTLSPVITGDDLIAIQQLIRAMPVADKVIAEAVALTASTRPKEGTPAETTQQYIEWGAGPRASQYLILGAKAFALMEGRAAPERQDVLAAATSVLSHRIVTNYRATGEGLTSSDVIAALLAERK
ncbi:AAA family ATPase [Roseibacillus persicicus]|uniref:ATPase AAA n=1 Tax=Roseibacillus persicicus TaxID=454148 RepID=A0A918TB65_9BACT|nr:MoxR family ATPase [Roseibacillus persicicus]MDQ8190738.1 MoxR family ATPase [Roseibacillus persicicus]GHC40600.1 ATPase AAA [Roseibacillus persicicus]